MKNFCKKWGGLKIFKKGNKKEGEGGDFCTSRELSSFQALEPKEKLHSHGKEKSQVESALFPNFSEEFK